MLYRSKNNLARYRFNCVITVNMTGVQYLRGPAGLESVFCIMLGNSLITGLALVIDNQNYIYT